MAVISRFSPYELDDATLHRIATGREALVERILAIIERNAARGPMQHLQLVAPRGYGKSFLIRLVRSALDCRAAEGVPLRMAMLPEEQRNVNAPHRLLDEIGRILAGRPAASVIARKRDGEQAWAESVAALDSEIAAVLPETGGVVVASVENFDVLLGRVFKKPQDQSRLRAWLARPEGRLMLLASSTKQADAKYEQRLFHATGVIQIDPWQEEACIAFFEKLRGLKHDNAMPPATLAKARAVAQFIGGSPRMATVLANILDSNDSIEAASLLDALIDELTPYYKHRLDDLPPEAESVLDTLLRGGEPATQSEVARRMGVEQSDIARPFQELRARGEVVGERAAGSAEVLYHVGDRLMAHYYRKRHLNVGEGASPLEAIAEFLARFFTTPEKQAEAQRLRGLGRLADAAVLERLWRAEMETDGLPEWLRESIEQTGKLVHQRQGAEAVALARATAVRASGDARLEAWALIDLGWSLDEMGQHQEAVAVLRRAIALADQAINPLGQAAAGRQLGWSLGQMGQHPEAVAVLRRAYALAEQTGDLREQAVASRYLGWSLGAIGQQEEAVAVSRRAVSLAEQASDPADTARAFGCLAVHAEAIGADAVAVEAWTGLSRSLGESSGVGPDPMVFFDVAAVSGLRSGRFRGVWQDARSLKAAEARPYTAPYIAIAMAREASAASEEGYAMVAQFVETLAVPEADKGSGPDPITLLKSVLGELIPRLTDPGLLRDIADLLATRLTAQTATEQALFRAAALRRERPDDPAALQREDPDIATAVDRMLGVSFAPAKPARRRAPRGTARKR